MSPYDDLSDLDNAIKQALSPRSSLGQAHNSDFLKVNAEVAGRDR